MKKTDLDPIPDKLVAELVAELDALEARGGRDIDTSDIPAVLDWSRATRGFYRPIKKAYSIRLDEDVVAWFKASGDGYQTRINAALREFVASHQKVS